MVKTSCIDWEKRIVARESLVPPPLFPEEADSAMDIFSGLRVVDVPGSPAMGDVSRPFLNDFVRSIFGAYNAESGQRLISEFFFLISKKNSKSTTAAGIMLTALIRNWRNSAEFLILAPTVEIANNSFYPARDMIRADPDLSSFLMVQDHIRTITDRRTKATLKVIAADSETVGGKKATGILVDELWLFGPKANAENMIREACGGLASRPEGFIVYLSTQSDAPPVGVFKQKLQYARDVRDGKIDDPRFLPILYEFPESYLKTKAYLKPENFYITNPNLGASVSEDFLKRELTKAQAAGESSMPGFLSKHLNIEIGQSLRSDNWAGALFWKAQSDKTLTLEKLLAKSDVVTVGIDGGGLDDLLGLAVLGRVDATGDWLLWTHAWAHPVALERRKSEGARYSDFSDAGELTVVDNVGDDVLQVAECIATIQQSGLLDRIGVDPSGIGALIDGITAQGISDDKLVGIAQGWTMTGAIQTTERKLATGSFWHAGSGLMEWCVGNAKVEPRGNAVVVTKQISGRAKIDPLLATFNAVTLMGKNPKSATKRYQVFFV